MAISIAHSQLTVTDEDLRQAWKQCRLVNMTYDAAMAIPSLSTALRRVAECNLRRHLRLAEQRQRDFKLAQANDHQDE